MNETLIQYVHEPDPANNRSKKVCKFVFYSTVDAEVQKVNIKYNIEASFDCRMIGELLKKFFGLSPTDSLETSVGIKREQNEKRMLVDYHGVVKSSPGITPDPLTALTTRRPDNKQFMDGDGKTYNLLEVGVNIGLWSPPWKTQTRDKIFDRAAKHMEIKYALPGNQNIRVVVNIHFKHDHRCRDLESGVKQLDEAIATIREHDVINEITLAEHVTAFNFKELGYQIAKNSQPYYMGIKPLLDQIQSSQTEEESQTTKPPSPGLFP
jgi:hypothetical protein